jgi:hypothetical protein
MKVLKNQQMQPKLINKIFVKNYTLLSYRPATHELFLGLALYM